LFKKDLFKLNEADTENWKTKVCQQQVPLVNRLASNINLFKLKENNDAKQFNKAFNKLAYLEFAMFADGCLLHPDLQLLSKENKQAGFKQNSMEEVLSLYQQMFRQTPNRK
jgi:hypothetical protein